MYIIPMPPSTSSSPKGKKRSLGSSDSDSDSDRDQDSKPTTSKNSKAPVMRKIIPDTTMRHEDFFHDPKHWKKVTTAEIYARRREVKELLLKYEQPEHIAKFALSDYNKKHGTHLEYVRLLDGKVKLAFWGYGSRIDFLEGHDYWNHLNFEARRYSADAGYESLVLFAEVYTPTPLCLRLTTLSHVNPADKSSGCQVCSDNIYHPQKGFRADASAAVDKHVLPRDEASYLSKLALERYNDQNGTNLVFIRARKCNKFTGVGLLMDFTEKNTTWVHVNFKAMVGGYEDHEGVELRLFAELYLGGDGNFVLATLLPTEPSNILLREKTLGIQCCCCPTSILHPWRGFRYGFSPRPGPKFPPQVEVASCKSEPHAVK